MSHSCTTGARFARGCDEAIREIFLHYCLNFIAMMIRQKFVDQIALSFPFSIEMPFHLCAPLITMEEILMGFR
jgi:hypothetical protein